MLFCILSNDNADGLHWLTTFIKYRVHSFYLLLQIPRLSHKMKEAKDIFFPLAQPSKKFAF